jgi:hypothetical protein
MTMQLGKSGPRDPTKIHATGAKSNLLNITGSLASLNSGSMPVHLRLHCSNNFA